MPSPVGSAVLLLAALALGACTSPSTVTLDPVMYREPLVDVEHYEIRVALQHEAGLVDGIVHVTFSALADRPAHELLLHAADMEIESVSDEQGEDLLYDYDGAELRIELPRTLAPGERALVSVDYRAWPLTGLFFVGPTRQDPGRPWSIWTQGQSDDTRRWVPVWDVPNDRATHVLAATVDERFITMGAGTLSDSRPHPRAGTRTDTWTMDVPHPSYLITLVAGDLAVGFLPGGPVPLPVVAEPDDMPHALENFALTGEMLTLFADLTGRPYPYPKYAQCCVRDYTAGGMENISATTLFYDTIHDPDDEPQIRSVGLVAHEAAHQWFGDLVTCRTWNHVWLNEGFATYYEALFTEHHEGRDAFLSEMLDNQRAYAGAQLATPKPIVWPRVDRPDDVFDDHAYPGGASVLHLLRDHLGTAAYHAGIAHYLREHEARSVETDDLRRALEVSTGRALRAFFDQWLHRAGVPIVHTTLVTEDDAGRGLEGVALRVEQVQGGRDDPWRDRVRAALQPEEPPFVFDVTVAWSRKGVEQRERFTIDRRVAFLPLGPGPIDWVRFDAETAVPMVLDHAQGEAMWAHQLLHARDGVTRRLAAEWFEGNGWVRWDDEDAPPAPESVAALVEAARADRFETVRVRAVHALARSDDPRAAQTALALIEDPAPRVREAAAQALGEIGEDEVLPALAHAVDDINGSVALAALEALDAREYPGAFTVASELYAETDKMRVQDGIVKLVGGMHDEARALAFLVAAARHNEHRRVRGSAMGALARRSGHDEVVVRELVAGLADPSYDVRASAARALAQRGDERVADALRARLLVEGHGSVRGAIEDALDALLGADRAAPRARRP